MEYTQQQGIVEKTSYFEVFDKDKKLRIGIASEPEKRKIEEEYPDKYHFEELESHDDYIGMDSGNMSKPHYGLTFEQSIILILVGLLVAYVIAGLIWPDRASFIQLYFNNTP